MGHTIITIELCGLGLLLLAAAGLDLADALRARMSAQEGGLIATGTAAGAIASLTVSVLIGWFALG